MLVICEDCAKKYNIDESKIQGTRARFVCKKCGYIIIVNKPEVSKSSVSSPKISPGGSTIDLVKEMQGQSAHPVHEENQEPSKGSPFMGAETIA